MKRYNKLVLGWGAVLLVSGGVCLAEDYKPERYNVILDRSPFGSDPLTGAPSPDLTAAVQATVAKLEKTYRLSFLLESQTGEIRAGFQNLKPKPGEPLSSVIRVGESFMGMKLKSVDLANSSATLEHNGQPITFQLTKRSQKATPKKPTPTSRRFGGGFKRTPPPRPVAPPRPKLTSAEQQQRRKEIRANLEKYQMEVLRKGMPPLPIPLTKEMDDQLVNEGILPPSN